MAYCKILNFAFGFFAKKFGTSLVGKRMQLKRLEWEGSMTRSAYYSNSSDHGMKDWSGQISA